MSRFFQTMSRELSGAKKYFAFLEKHLLLVNVSTLAVVFICGLFYIWQVNVTAASGYKIRELEVQIKELTLVNQKIEAETRLVQSLDNVAQSVKILGMVPSERPEYVS